MEAGEDTVAAVQAKPEHEGVGAMLRSRRTALGLSQADVAQMVKLPPRRIEAMEQERWEELPDGPYLRGFLRNIARALDLDSATLMERVDASLVRSRSPESILVAPGVTNVTLPRRNGPADDRRGGRALVFGAFGFAIVAALIAWSGTDSFDRATTAVRSLVDPSRQAASVAPAPSGTTSTDIVSPVASGTSMESAPAQAAPVVADASAPASTAGAGASALALHFNEEAWVEVRSADGKVLLHQLNAAGSEKQIDGEAPFSLVVGNAKGVALRFRGQPVDLAPYTRDQVARLTLS